MSRHVGVAVRRRDRRPDEHGAFGVGDVPADGAQAGAEGVAAGLVVFALLLDHVGRAGQSGDGGFLDREEDAEVDLTPHLAERRDDVRPADEEAHSGAGDVEGLRQAEELGADVDGTVILQEAAALHAVEDDVRVGVVVEQQDVIFLREGDELFVDLIVADAAHRVRRQGDDHELRPLRDVFRNGGDVRQEVRLGRHRVVPRLRAGHLGAGDEHGVARRRQQDGVALIDERHADMAHALLRAVAGADHVRRDGHAEAPVVVRADGVEEFRQVAQGVFPVLGVHRRFCQGFPDMQGSLEVRGADAHIEQRASLGLELEFFVVQRSEDLVSEAVHAFGKLHLVRSFFRFRGLFLKYCTTRK